MTTPASAISFTAAWQVCGVSAEPPTAAMARRHAIDVFDPDLIRKQTQTEVRAKMAASGQVKVTMSAAGAV